MDFTPSLNAKGFFRFTGPPENWLTAIKYMTWGLEEKMRSRWEEIQEGDVFFIHSTGPQTSLFKNAKSGIIGLGVVGSQFSAKNGPLWIHEVKEKVNKWPLMIPFSEIYLFSEIPAIASWSAPTPTNGVETKNLVDALLKNLIPLSSIKGFPQMGSFSSVSKNVSQQILLDRRPLYVYSGSPDIISLKQKPTKLESVKSASETLRYAGTLQVFDSIKTRIVKKNTEQYSKNNELLARAEVVHSSILQQLIELFRERGYETLSNKFVDLFAHRGDRSFLFEVKSTENLNFRAQARKGVIQLFEYDYFDIKKYTQENNLSFADKYKILVPSRVPEDNKYVEFINSLRTGVAVIENGSLRVVGMDFGFSKI